MRYYPLFMNFRNDYRPLPEGLRIEDSPIHGQGLFTEHKILRGRVLGVTHWRQEDNQDAYIRTPLGGFVNNSETPNARLVSNDNTCYMIATEQIEPGSEITVRYGVVKKDWS